MSLKDLKEAGVLLPREEWGTRELRSAVNKPALILAGLLGIVAIILMYHGGGGAVTFVGTGLFLAFMGWISYICISAIDRQAAEFEPGRRAGAAASPSDSDST